MLNVKLERAILEKLAKAEVDALLEGLDNEEMRNNPAFLAKVRQFLKDNELIVTPKLEGVNKLMDRVNNIPMFDDLDNKSI